MVKEDSRNTPGHDDEIANTKQDNASAHGTQRNGKALQAHDKVALADGDVLVLGASTRSYHVSITRSASHPKP